MDIILTTPEQLKEIIKDCLESYTFDNPDTKNKEAIPQEEYLYSIKELAKFLGCSTTKAQELKNKRIIRYRQYGRKLIFLRSEVLEDLYNNKKYK